MHKMWHLHICKIVTWRLRKVASFLRKADFPPHRLLRRWFLVPGEETVEKVQLVTCKWKWKLLLWVWKWKWNYEKTKTPEQGRSTGSCCASWSPRIHNAPHWGSFPWEMILMFPPTIIWLNLNLGRNGTSSSKDKKLNWTVEARWKKQPISFPEHDLVWEKCNFGKNIGFEAIYTRLVGSSWTSFCKVNVRKKAGRKNLQELLTVLIFSSHWNI